jgi:predicted phosphodiesterase
MKIAIISDIHANLPALRAVLESIRRDEVDRTVCLGDIVGFHTSPGECIDLLLSHGVTCIAGNHDDGVVGKLGPQYFPRECWEAIAWTRRELRPDHLSFLLQLPRTLSLDDAGLLMHGMFENNHRYLVGRAKLLYTSLRMKAGGWRLAFHGHTHSASCYRIHGKLLPLRVEQLATSTPLYLSQHTRYIINPGSVGEPRNGDPRAMYAVLDTETSCIMWQRTRYDHAGVIQQTLSCFPTHARLHSPARTGTADPVAL